MIKKILITALALMAVSCIYPFTPDSEDGSGALVIEGDILIGKETVVTVSRTAPVSKPDLNFLFHASPVTFRSLG